MASRPRFAFAVAVVVAILVVGGGCAPGGGAATPTDLRAALTSFDTIELTWTTPAGQDGVQLQGRLAGGAWEAIGDAPADAIGLVISLAADAPEAADFGFRIRGVKGGAVSEWSGEATVHRGVRPATGLVVDGRLRPAARHRGPLDRRLDPGRGDPGGATVIPPEMRRGRGCDPGGPGGRHLRRGHGGSLAGRCRRGVPGDLREGIGGEHACAGLERRGAAAGPGRPRGDPGRPALHPPRLDGQERLRDEAGGHPAGSPRSRPVRGGHAGPGGERLGGHRPRDGRVRLLDLGARRGRRQRHELRGRQRPGRRVHDDPGDDPLDVHARRARRHEGGEGRGREVRHRRRIDVHGECVAGGGAAGGRPTRPSGPPIPTCPARASSCGRTGGSNSSTASCSRSPPPSTASGSTGPGTPSRCPTSSPPTPSPGPGGS